MKRCRLAAALLSAALLLAACEREQRRFQPPPAASAAADAAPALQRTTSLRPGAGDPVQPAVAAASQAAVDEHNAYAVSQGKRLFRWYNCSGCHGQGGGSYGPALMDTGWRYGHTPQDIYATLAQGRPNGMPAFGGRIPPDQLWQLVAYVRSLGGQLRKDVAPSRGDTAAGAPPENTREPAPPVPESPSASRPKPPP